MASRVALLSFQFQKISDLEYDPELDHDFSRLSTPYPGEANQPVVAEAVTQIRLCLSESVSSMFKFGHAQLQNLNNFIHVGTICYDTHIENQGGSSGQHGVIVIFKFYLIKCTSKGAPHWRVNIDIEQMPNSSLDPLHEHEYGSNFTDKQIEDLAKSLNEVFQLHGEVEYTSFIKRGRTQDPSEVHCHYHQQQQQQAKLNEDQETLAREQLPNKKETTSNP